MAKVRYVSDPRKVEAVHPDYRDGASSIEVPRQVFNLLEIFAGHTARVNEVHNKLEDLVYRLAGHCPVQGLRGENAPDMDDDAKTPSLVDELLSLHTQLARTNTRTEELIAFLNSRL